MPKQFAGFRGAVQRKREQQALKGLVRIKPADLRFPQQQALWEDPSKAKVAFCGRRAGKTLGWALDAAQCLQEHPGEMVLYVGITRNAARDIIWRAFKRLNDEYGWGLKFRESDLRAIHPNGSQFVVMGGDKLPELEKARGPERIRLAIVDECQSHKPFNLQYLVEEVLEPGMMDVGGTLCLSGTPGLVPTGFWFEATTGQRKGWSVHSWTAADNPHVDFAEFVERLKETRGWDDDNPVLRREYYREWIRDESRLVFPFEPSRNVINVLPAFEKDQWKYVLALDFGYVNSTAWVLLGYGPYGKEVYIIRSFKKAGQTPEKVAQTTQKLIDEWNPQIIVGDLGGLGKAYAVHMIERYGIAIKPADKRDKRGTLDFVADGLRTGLVKSLKDNITLHNEFTSIVWDDEHADIADGQDDHEAEAFCYGYKETPAYLNKDVLEQSEYDGLPSWVKRPDEDHEQYQRRRRKRGNAWDETEDMY